MQNGSLVQRLEVYQSTVDGKWRIAPKPSFFAPFQEKTRCNLSELLGNSTPKIVSTCYDAKAPIWAPEAVISGIEPHIFRRLLVVATMIRTELE